MRYLNNLFCLLLCLFALPGNASDLKGLTFATEAYPPYNFKEAGKLQGIAVDLLVSASAQAGSPIATKDIRLLPWARAYKMAEEGPNVVLFSTTRTEERESKFQWVGPISKTRVVLLTKKSSGISISSEADMKALTIGAIRDDIGQQLVKAAGVGDQSIKLISKAENLAQMLNHGRIDAWAYEENVARWFIKQRGFNNEEFETAYVLKESDLYYTFSKDISKDKIETLQKGIDAIKASGEYEKIRKNYL